MLRVGAEQGLGERLSRAARARVEGALTWERAGRALLEAYAGLLSR